MSVTLTRRDENEPNPERGQLTCQVFLNLAGLEACCHGQT